MKKYVVDPDELDELHGPVKIIFVLLRKVKVYNFIRRMKVKVYNLVRHTWLIVADDLLMLGLSSFRRKLFDFQAFHNQAHIINLSGIIIYFCGTYYLYAHKHGDWGVIEPQPVGHMCPWATGKPVQAEFHFYPKSCTVATCCNMLIE